MDLFDTLEPVSVRSMLDEALAELIAAKAHAEEAFRLGDLAAEETALDAGIDVALHILDAIPLEAEQELLAGLSEEGWNLDRSIKEQSSLEVLRAGAVLVLELPGPLDKRVDGAIHILRKPRLSPLNEYLFSCASVTKSNAARNVAERIYVMRQQAKIYGGAHLITVKRDVHDELDHLARLFDTSDQLSLEF